MRRRSELVERLAAADPAPDGERLTMEEQQEAEALLERLLATAPERAVQRGGERRLRRWALAAAAVAVAAAAAVAVTTLLDSDARGPDVVERAAAAVSRDGVIYHFVERREVRASYEPLDMDTYVESWHTSDGRIHQKAYAAKGRRGRLLEDWAGRRLPGRRVWPRLRWDAWTNTISEGAFGPSPDHGAPVLGFFGDHGAQLRRLQAQGRLRVAGTTRVGQRRAYRLVSGPVRTPDYDRGEERVEFIIDADTYLPLAQRFSLRGRSTEPGHPKFRIQVNSRFLVYERLPLNPRNRKLLHLGPHPGAKCSEFAHELSGRRGVGVPNPCARPGPGK
jgi:hypothetical protein